MRRDQRRRVGVVGADLALRAKGERVGGTDRPGAGRGGMRQRQSPLLVGDRHVGAGEPGAGEGRDGFGEQLGGHGQELIAPLAQAGSGQRRILDRRRAAVGDRPAQDAEPAPRGSFAAVGAPVDGQQVLELCVAGGEHRLVRARLGEEVQVAVSGPGARPPRSTPGRGCRSAWASARNGCACCTAIRLKLGDGQRPGV